MIDKKSIDPLVRDYLHSETHLKNLGEQIKSQSKFEVVLFVDLCNSTRIKDEFPEEQWLGYIYNFIESVTQFAKKASGEVVKRIGDELMISFSQVKDAEVFLSKLESDSDFNNRYKYKIATDYGFVYHFSFGMEKMYDPYGQVVDRCARIAKLAKEGTVLCSEDYTQELEEAPDNSRYVELFPIDMKGFKEPQMLCVRLPEQTENRAEYLAPLIETLNEDAPVPSSYRSVSREFTPSFFEYRASSSGRPFLLRELLNVPQLPISPEDLCSKVEKLGRDHKERFKFYGFLVDWEVEFYKFLELFGEYLSVMTKSNNATIFLDIPDSMRDVVCDFKKGTKIRVRGIIEKIDGDMITLNYVDLAYPAGTPE